MILFTFKIALEVTSSLCFQISCIKCSSEHISANRYSLYVRKWSLFNIDRETDYIACYVVDLIKPLNATKARVYQEENTRKLAVEVVE